jgi:hypothetical protein
MEIIFLWLVPVEGIEPTLLAEHDFESCASTNSATRAGGAIIAGKGKGSIFRRSEATQAFRSRAVYAQLRKLACKWRVCAV